MAGEPESARLARRRGCLGRALLDRAGSRCGFCSSPRLHEKATDASDGVQPGSVIPFRSSPVPIGSIPKADETANGELNTEPPPLIPGQIVISKKAKKPDKKYHIAPCPHIGRIDKDNRRILESAEEADNLGYVLCDDCRKRQAKVASQAAPTD